MIKGFNWENSVCCIYEAGQLPRSSLLDGLFIFFFLKRDLHRIFLDGFSEEMLSEES